jgi:hypothetical protein
MHNIIKNNNLNMKPYIVCDQQGGVLVIDDRLTHSSGFLTNIIKKEQLTKDYLLNNYIIKYDSFYECSSGIDNASNPYFGLVDENTVINFLISL